MAGFILDFYCVSAHLAVETDGGQHADAVNAAYDLKRTRRPHRFRCPDYPVLGPRCSEGYNTVAVEILRQLNAPSARPSPGVPGERE
jgi:very-short-patch-repair endonuclease